MKRMIVLIGLMAALVIGGVARAQQAGDTQNQVWLQIEAQPTLREAEDRARAYGGAFPDVAGFQLNSGWYAITLGPYAPQAGAAKLADLKSERLVPDDSFIAFPRSFRQQFWPVTLPGAAAAALPVLAEPAPQQPAAAETSVQPVLPAELSAELSAGLPDETPAEARRAEAALTREDRQSLQTALQWFGYSNAARDGAFGPGTRQSMAAWQEANALDPTGILTSPQRATLLAGYVQAQAALGLQSINEPEAGIEITLPLALVSFDHYEPPFVHFPEKDGSGVSVILISQPGDQSTLYGLYDTLQTLAVMPLDGPRERGERSFTITGQNATRHSHAYAELSKGLIKGYILSWNATDGARIERVLAAMQKSFKPFGDRALDPGLVALSDATRQGLLSGLEVRHPALSRSGFYVDATGTVLTTPEATQSCARITLDTDTEADVIWSDARLGLTLLKPRQALAPRGVAALQTVPARIGGEVAVAGFSYEDALSAPTLTFGTLEDITGLRGEAGISRLAVDALPGDAGGPVFDTSGAVLGMLLPRATDAARQLPAGVSFAASASVLTGILAQAGIATVSPERQGAMAPEDLTLLAERMTVLVSCWN
ncbi:MAG: serine protease [Paracoccaceae bacterium]|nr:serine protease [Paracoccaceae bacterium]